MARRLLLWTIPSVGLAALAAGISAGDPPVEPQLPRCAPATDAAFHGAHAGGGAALPAIEVDQANRRVRVDTAGGPRWIRLCVRGGSPALATSPFRTARYPGCLQCHGQLENFMQNMFGMDLDCTFCHGGDPYSVIQDEAHVHPDGTVAYDQTVPPIDQDLEYQRFLNPSNLRAVSQTCGFCHPTHASDIKKSMMATAAGHYAGGLYQNGVVDTKSPVYGTFAVVDDDGYVPTNEGAVASLEDLVIYDPSNDPNLVATHFQAVPSQACARCHLWSRGKGYRGAANADGTYRADGCAACHVLYSDDGRSQSADMSIDHHEQGHALAHFATKQVPTGQCLHCHHRGARIGLSFTGRAQMPPRLPSGPGVPGTTDVRFNGNFHYTVSDTNPPDIHGERGLHCIDCHVRSELMGDGNIWGHMDQATNIECRSCHGLHDQPPSLADNDGGPLPNVAVDPNGDVVLTSKVTGAQHLVPELVEIVDPTSPSYNPQAAACMNDDHLKDSGGMECYACHSAWVPNCYGCHFERDETQLGLNLMTGQYEVGKASTNNKIFEALRNISIGLNSEGRVAPYIVGCQAIADVTAPDGSKILEYKMPVTANGLSGLALNPVNPHTTRSVGETRSCAECHRSPPSLGLGTGNYLIGRERVYTATAAGVELFDRAADPCRPALERAIAAPGVLAVASRPHVIEGTAEHLYLACGPAGVRVYDRQLEPASGEPVQTITGLDAIDLARDGRHLYVVENGVGLRVYDDRDPARAKHLASLALPQALRVVPWGVHLFVPCGPAGLAVVDVTDPEAPTLAGIVGGMNAVDVELYAHFQRGPDFAARAYVADPAYGVRILDLLPDFADAELVGGLPLIGATGLDAYTRYVIATATEPSREHDYLYVAAGAAGLHVFDMTDPEAITPVSAVTDLGGELFDVAVVSQLAPPGVDDYAYIANASLGLQVVDVTDPASPSAACGLPAGAGATRVLVEAQQMDRFVNEYGDPLKENSHPGVDTFTRADIVRILTADIP